MHILLKIFLVIACGVFGLTIFTYNMSKKGSKQRATDNLVLWVSGIVGVCSGVMLWTFGW
jgi:hypothetical protein